MNQIQTCHETQLFGKKKTLVLRLRPSEAGEEDQSPGRSADGQP